MTQPFVSSIDRLSGCNNELAPVNWGGPFQQGRRKIGNELF
jgi:hypothetical protein